MRFPAAVASMALAASCRPASGLSFQIPGFGGSLAKSSKDGASDNYHTGGYDVVRSAERITPKVMIISMFEPEAIVWYDNMPSSGFGNIMAQNITTPGLSPVYPYIHCTASEEICQITVGEAEINTAASISALLLSPKFDLRQTYFLVAGIAGINPKVGTQGSVAFSKYAVQVALQYEFDAREMPDNFTTGYFSYGATGPNEYPSILYGTEVFEVNENLRDRAMEFAARAKLADTKGHREYGLRYLDMGSEFVPAGNAPAVIRADSATSDVYYSGSLLSDAFENITALLTNGTGTYGVTAQEENATLEVMLRMAVEGIVDFGRVIIMRTGSNFDRPPPGISVYEHLVILDQSGLGIATENIYRAGIEVVKGILESWECTFKAGIKAENYIGDIFGSLGGVPDFGLGTLSDGEGVPSAEDRAQMGRNMGKVRARGAKGWGK
ncbi:hypothetical protein MKZ38_004267 [Zalerion maritima]|uniref:Purine nucleoside permease n=1 Tax=Zalerion maritima TaxID=339359 RepID=A0AAD5RYI5_9PEZI|nr:hypothetical protein MKZ38_004267 [Zalerion maritima]